MFQDFLDIRRLRYLIAISDAGSLTAAARALNIAQPALSYHLSELERLIGGSLFNRKSTGMEPTALGLILIGHAVQIVDRIHEAEADVLRRVDEDPAGKKIRLSIIPSLATTLSPALFKAFGKALPKHSLHLIDARSAFAKELLEKEKADFAIQLIADQGLEDEPLAWEEMFCIAPAEHGVAPMEFSEVASSDLILPASGNPLRRFLEDAARENELSLCVSMEVDGFEPRKRMVRAGLGTTVFGEFSIAPEVLEPGLVARRIVEPVLKRPIYLTHRNGLEAEVVSMARTALVNVFSHAAVTT